MLLTILTFLFGEGVIQKGRVNLSLVTKEGIDVLAICETNLEKIISQIILSLIILSQNLKHFYNYLNDKKLLTANISGSRVCLRC